MDEVLTTSLRWLWTLHNERSGVKHGGVIQKVLVFWGKWNEHVSRGQKWSDKQIKANLGSFFPWMCIVLHMALMWQCNPWGNLTFIIKIEVFFINMHGYFSHSPKRHLEFQRLAQTLETKGNKIFKNVKTRWMSMLDALKRIMVEYCPLFVMMQADYSTIHVAKVFLSP